LNSKFDDCDFLEYLRTFDIICLVETFISEYANVDWLPDYHMYFSPAIKLSSSGRRSGGVCVLVRQNIVKRCIRIETDIDNLICLKFPKSVFNLTSDFVLLCMYVPPLGSSFYRSRSNSGCHIDRLETFLSDHLSDFGNSTVLVCGDVNARTGDENNPVNEAVEDLGPNNDVYTDVDSFPVEHRSSHDTIVNGFGRILLDLCYVYRLFILNGRAYGDRGGEYTFIGENGSSVVDYFFSSANLFQYVDMFNIGDRLDSDHFPLELTLNFPTTSNPTCSTIEEGRSSKVVWNESKQELYISGLRERLNLHGNALIENIEVDVEEAIYNMVELILDSAKCMVKDGQPRRSQGEQPPLNMECRSARCEARRSLRIYKRHRTENNRKQYCTLRNKYKSNCRKLKRDLQTSRLKELTGCLHSPRLFWKNIRRLQHRPNHNTSISSAQWLQHFKKLFSSEDAAYDSDDVPDSVADVNNEFGEIDLLLLESPITETEIHEAILHLKCGKSSGVDGVISEMLKYSLPDIMPFLVKSFNAIFDSGVFPQDWSKSIIVPLFKNGCRNNPDNYRGISLTSILSKCFTSIINKRLTQWSNMRDLIPETQAGFRRDYSTFDHIFTLYAIIERYLSFKKRKLYVAFVDFKKAFDSVNRGKLWNCLRRKNLRGKMLTILMSMYSNVRSCVRNGSTVTDYFDCPIGLRQGCVLSPILFSFFINELYVEIMQSGKHGVQLFPDILELFMLLFADDVILMSSSIIGLQKQLDILAVYSDEWKLNVNMDKTSIVIFRKGGHVAKREKWRFKGCFINVVKEYKYLGLLFSHTLNLNKSVSNLSEEGSISNAFCHSKTWYYHPSYLFQAF